MYVTLPADGGRISEHLRDRGDRVFDVFLRLRLVFESVLRLEGHRGHHRACPGAEILRGKRFSCDLVQVFVDIVGSDMHHTGDRDAKIEEGRFLAEHIPGARFVEFQGADHSWWTEGRDEIIDEIEEMLTGNKPAREADRVLATVLFTDIVGSTQGVVDRGDRAWLELLKQHHALVRKELARFRGREVNTIGDSFIAIFDGPARAVRCACNIRDSITQLGIELRAGLHTGEIELLGDDIAGIAVHIGARVAAAAQPNEVLVSSTVRDLVAGSAIVFADRGVRVLKGVPGERQLFAANPL